MKKSSTSCQLFEILTGYSLIVFWLIGIVLAKGWLFLVAIVLPPYGWYLVVEKILIVNGVI